MRAPRRKRATKPLPHQGVSNRSLTGALRRFCRVYPRRIRTAPKGRVWLFRIRLREGGA